jgi:hypothetical protein
MELIACFCLMQLVICIVFILLVLSQNQNVLHNTLPPFFPKDGGNIVFRSVCVLPCHSLYGVTTQTIETLK